MLEEEEEEVVQDQEVIEIEEQRPRRSVRLPPRFKDFDLNFVELDILETFEQAMKSKETMQWKFAI